VNKHTTIYKLTDEEARAAEIDFPALPAWHKDRQQKEPAMNEITSEIMDMIKSHAERYAKQVVAMRGAKNEYLNCGSLHLQVPDGSLPDGTALLTDGDALMAMIRNNMKHEMVLSACLLAGEETKNRIGLRKHGTVKPVAYLDSYLFEAVAGLGLQVACGSEDVAPVNVALMDGEEIVGAVRTLRT